MSTATITTESSSDITGNQAANQWRYFWLMLFVSVSPMMVPYFSNLWSREPYRFFPFCLLAIGWLIYLRWDRVFRAPRGIPSWIAIGVGVCMTTLGIAMASPWICAVALVAFGTVFCLSARDRGGRSLVEIALLFVMLVNLPLGYDQLLTIRLQQTTTALSSVFLDVLAIPHAVSNNVIQLTTRELFVAEACSGIQSVFTLMFLSVLLIAFHRRPIWLAPVYLAIAALLAVAANVLRVAFVAIGDVWLSMNLAEGWQHELVGYTALCLGVLFLLSFDHLVVTLLHPVDPVVDGENNLLIGAWNFLVGEGARVKSNDGHRRTPPVEWDTVRGVRFWQSLWSRRIVVGVLSVLAVAAAAQAVNLHRPVPIFVSPTAVIYQPAASVFDRPFDSIEVSTHEQSRGGSNPRLGENADIWNCLPLRVKADAQVVLSQPYVGWHELCICYEINAWILLNREIRGSADGEETVETPNRSIPYAFARFKNDDGRFAYLIYTAVDEQGNVVEPPPRPGRLGNRFLTYFGDPQQSATSNLMMMQMFLVADEQLEADSLRELAADFVEMRSIIQQDVRDARGDVRDASNSDSGPSDDLAKGEGE